MYMTNLCEICPSQKERLQIGVLAQYEITNTNSEKFKEYTQLNINVLGRIIKKCVTQ